MPQACISYNLKAHMRPAFGQTVGGPSFIAAKLVWEHHFWLLYFQRFCFEEYRIFPR